MSIVNIRLTPFLSRICASLLVCGLVLDPTLANALTRPATLGSIRSYRFDDEALTAQATWVERSILPSMSPARRLVSAFVLASIFLYASQSIAKDRAPEAVLQPTFIENTD